VGTWQAGRIANNSATGILAAVEWFLIGIGIGGWTEAQFGGHARKGEAYTVHVRIEGGEPTE
jgi:hypothetical protein